VQLLPLPDAPENAGALANPVARQRPGFGSVDLYGLSEVYIGKESNKQEEVEVGLVGDLEDVLAIYVDEAASPWQQLAVPLLRHLPYRLHPESSSGDTPDGQVLSEWC
jgi:hypothetical protein